eukprot:gene28244-31347_t
MKVKVKEKEKDEDFVKVNRRSSEVTSRARPGVSRCITKGSKVSQAMAALGMARTSMAVAFDMTNDKNSNNDIASALRRSARDESTTALNQVSSLASNHGSETNKHSSRALASNNQVTFLASNPGYETNPNAVIGSLHSQTVPSSGHEDMTAGVAFCAITTQSINLLVQVVKEFIALYGATVILLENLQDFDTWSWQLLCKVSTMYNALLELESTTQITLEPFNLKQTRKLMQIVAGTHFPDAYVTAIMEKTGGMPYYIEEITDFVSRKPISGANGESAINVSDMIRSLTFQQSRKQISGANRESAVKINDMIHSLTFQQCRKPISSANRESAINVNDMIHSLPFQEVVIERIDQLRTACNLLLKVIIEHVDRLRAACNLLLKAASVMVVIERIDRLRTACNLLLKVASVMGQWVDVEILHRIYPIHMTLENLRGLLIELERGHFLKATEAPGVWEFNMRRQLHAKLAQELERSLDHGQMATLTTVAYHWNQACTGNEKSAESAYAGSSLMEALKLYYKASRLAEIMGDEYDEGLHGKTENLSPDRTESGGATAASSAAANAFEGGQESDADKCEMSSKTNADLLSATYGAANATLRRQKLNWSLVSVLARAQLEKCMASCCLGIVLQQRIGTPGEDDFYQVNDDFYQTNEHFTLLIEHAVRALMILGVPHPQDLMPDEDEVAVTHSSWWSCLWACQAEKVPKDSLWRAQQNLQAEEVEEVREILLVMIIAAENMSSSHNGGEDVRLLTFCIRVCSFFDTSSSSP